MSEKKQREVPAEALARQREFARMAKPLLMRRYGRVPLAYVHSFGCQQNQSDGEKLMGMLEEMGCAFGEAPETADIVLYNTCAIRENAEDRVFGNVGALKPVKQSHPKLLIGLCGCMMQQHSVAEKIKKSYPYIDLVFGTHALYTLPELLYNRLSGQKRQFSNTDSDGEIAEGLPLRREGAIKANLPIMYGCDNFCTYCIVPYVRGRERSRQPGAILAEAKALAESGCREIMLLGQNVNSYGKGLDEPVNFAALLRRIAALDGEFVIRFMTSHPKDCTRELVDVIAENPKICKHIHLPVQSGSNRVLEAMNRRYTVESYLELIDYARERVPGIGFSSDIIVGFPGETYEEFQQTLALIQKVGYNALYTFIYSPREGTKAALMDDPVPAAEKSRWMGELLAAQQEIRDRQQQSMVGKTIRVLADSTGKTGEGWLSGRTEWGDIAEFTAPKEKIGSFVEVEISRALNWAVFGRLADTN